MEMKCNKKVNSSCNNFLYCVLLLKSFESRYIFSQLPPAEECDDGQLELILPF
jgi:hypothetical protein